MGFSQAPCPTSQRGFCSRGASRFWRELLPSCPVINLFSLPFPALSDSLSESPAFAGWSRDPKTYDSVPCPQKGESPWEHRPCAARHQPQGGSTR